MRKLRVLLCGAFGYGNLGDNLIRDEAIRFFNEYFPYIDVYVDRPHPNDELIDYVDLRIIGPGGLLYDKNERHNEYFKKYMKKPFITMGTGFQHIEDIKEDGIIKHCIKNADIMIQRHLDDIKIIGNYRSIKYNIFLAPDFGYYFSNTNLNSFCDIPKKEKIVCGCFNKNTEHLLSEELLKEIDTFVSFHEEDNEMMSKISKFKNDQRTTNEYYFDSYEYLYSIIKQVDLLITSRYHAGILGKLNRKTKICYLTDEDNSKGSGYKLVSEFKNKFNKEQFLNDRDGYISSLDTYENVAGILEISKLSEYRNDIAKILNKYFETCFPQILRF